MIQPPRPRRGGTTQVFQSQLALELGLNAYAVVSAVLLFRLVLLVLEVDDRVWIGRVIYRVTDPLVWPLTQLPASSRTLLGDATLPDLTMAALVVLVPLGLVARAGKNRR